MSDSLHPHGLQHARFLSQPLSSTVCSNSCSLSQWCHSTISSSVAPFTFCPQSLPASGSFPMSLCIRWPKYWSFSFSISPSNEYSGLISFRMNWFDFLSVQGTHKSFLQHHSLKKASVLWHSAFFMIQLSSSLNTCFWLVDTLITLIQLQFYSKMESLLLFKSLSYYQMHRRK